MKYVASALVIGSVLFISGCSSLKSVADSEYFSKEKQTVSSSSSAHSDAPPSVIQAPSTSNDSHRYGVGVNGFLWRSCLDILSFMPLSSADPFGGVIISDWYSPPNAPNSRFKVTAYILSSSLQSDALRIAVFRQARTDNGDWLDMEVSETVSSDLENTVLARARELRVRANPAKD